MPPRAGQLEEDVVERRAADGDVLDADAGLVEPARGLSDLAGAVRERDAEGPVLDEGAPVRDRREGRQRRLAPVSVVETDLELVAPNLVLQVVGGPFGDDDAVVDDRDPVGEPIRFVQLLRREKHGRALGDELLDRVPEPDPAAEVETGRRLVEEEHRRPRHERRGQVEAPTHATRVGADEPPSGLDEVERGQQLVGAGT